MDFPGSMDSSDGVVLMGLGNAEESQHAITCEALDKTLVLVNDTSDTVKDTAVNILLNIPISSAAIDTVTESRMAIALSRESEKSAVTRLRSASRDGRTSAAQRASSSLWPHSKQNFAPSGSPVLHLGHFMVSPRRTMDKAPAGRLRHSLFPSDSSHSPARLRKVQAISLIPLHGNPTIELPRSIMSTESAKASTEKYYLPTAVTWRFIPVCGLNPRR